MGRPTMLVSKLRALEAEIEAWAQVNGRAASRDRLYREIWDVLTGGAAFEAVRECSRRASGLASWIASHLRRARDNALGKALLEYTELGASHVVACRRWGVRPSEWQYLLELASYLDEKVRRGVRLREWPAAWLSEAEEGHQEAVVLVEDQALQDMVLGALEAYSVPKGRGSRYSEVYGVCFGSVKTEQWETRGYGRQWLEHVLVRRVALQLRAQTTSGSVRRSPRSQAVHLEMAHDLFPHLDLVGDFHSHPYTTLERLRYCRGWEYTRGDEEDNVAWLAEIAEAGYHPRVGLILAIARAAKAQGGRHPAANILRSTIGRCHCYLAAYRINRDGTYSTSDVTLRCPTITGLGAT